MKYIVVFSYAIDIEAKDEDEALAKAKEKWGDVAPRPDEMNVEIEYCEQTKKPKWPDYVIEEEGGSDVKKINK